MAAAVTEVASTSSGVSTGEGKEVATVAAASAAIRAGLFLDARDVGSKVEIYWAKDDMWYPGRIVSVGPMRRARHVIVHRIQYDDGDRRVHVLGTDRHPTASSRFRILRIVNATATPTAAAASTAPDIPDTDAAAPPQANDDALYI